MLEDDESLAAVAHRATLERVCFLGKQATCRNLQGVQCYSYDTKPSDDILVYDFLVAEVPPQRTNAKEWLDKIALFLKGGTLVWLVSPKDAVEQVAVIAGHVPLKITSKNTPVRVTLNESCSVSEVLAFAGNASFLFTPDVARIPLLQLPNKPYCTAYHTSGKRVGTQIVLQALAPPEHDLIKLAVQSADALLQHCEAPDQKGWRAMRAMLLMSVLLLFIAAFAAIYTRITVAGLNRSSNSLPGALTNATSKSSPFKIRWLKVLGKDSTAFDTSAEVPPVLLEADDVNDSVFIMSAMGMYWKEHAILRKIAEAEEPAAGDFEYVKEYLKDQNIKKIKEALARRSFEEARYRAQSAINMGRVMPAECIRDLQLTFGICRKVAKIGSSSNLHELSDEQLRKYICGIFGNTRSQDKFTDEEINALGDALKDVACYMNGIFESSNATTSSGRVDLWQGVLDRCKTAVLRDEILYNMLEARHESLSHDFSKQREFFDECVRFIEGNRNSYLADDVTRLAVLTAANSCERSRLSHFLKQLLTTFKTSDAAKLVSLDVEKQFENIDESDETTAPMLVNALFEGDTAGGQRSFYSVLTDHRATHGAALVDATERLFRNCGHRQLFLDGTVADGLGQLLITKCSANFMVQGKDPLGISLPVLRRSRQITGLHLELLSRFTKSVVIGDSDCILISTRASGNLPTFEQQTWGLETAANVKSQLEILMVKRPFVFIRALPTEDESAQDDADFDGLVSIGVVPKILVAPSSKPDNDAIPPSTD